jgi:four helix bundle protein
MKSDIPERCFKFACRVVKLCQTLDATPGVSRVLASQLLRSDTSAGANVAKSSQS